MHIINLIDAYYVRGVYEIKCEFLRKHRQRKNRKKYFSKIFQYRSCRRLEYTFGVAQTHSG